MESIEELSASGGQGGDQLLPPPTNPAGPPQAIADMIRNSAQRNVDWVKTPGRVMQGVAPTVPGQWSEEDEFRQQSLNQHQYDWGAQTAFSDVFWPRTGGTGQVTSGAAIPPKRTTVQGSGLPVEVGKGPAKIEVPAGWKVTPVEHDPFDGALGSQVNTGPISAQQITALMSDRVSFDSRIGALVEMPGKDLRRLAVEVLGYEPLARSKADIVAALKRHQRQWELNADRSKAQDKIKP